MKHAMLYGLNFVPINVFFTIVFVGSVFFGVSIAKAQAPSGASTCEIKQVSPAKFGVGSVILLKGMGFDDGDLVLLNNVPLENVNITPNAITATIPQKIKSGTEIAIQRGKKKVAKARDFIFAKSPKVRNTKPSYGVTGMTILVSGAELDSIDVLKIGDAKVEVVEKSRSELRFIVPGGLRTGTLTVTGVGGTASMKKVFEVFYPPQLEKVEPSSGFEGDLVSLKGLHLNAAKTQFYLGKKLVKLVSSSESTMVFAVPKAAKSGSISAKVRNRTYKYGTEFTVLNRPLLKMVPTEAKIPGTMLVKGQFLDEVEKWMFGSSELVVDANYSKNSSKVIRLLLPETLSGQHVLKALSHGAEVVSEKPLKIVGSSR